jgi:hypothetical protein
LTARELCLCKKIVEIGTGWVTGELSHSALIMTAAPFLVPVNRMKCRLLIIERQWVVGGRVVAWRYLRPRSSLKDLVKAKGY